MTNEAAFQEYFWNLNRADQGFPVDERTARWMFAQRQEEVENDYSGDNSWA